MSARLLIDEKIARLLECIRELKSERNKPAHNFLLRFGLDELMRNSSCPATISLTFRAHGGPWH
jgi:hypothetical protein